MKTVLTAVAAFALLVWVGPGPALANGAGNGMVGSPHDFSGSDWNGREEICRVCHVPHDHSKATKYFETGLLWNHALSEATYTMYDSAWSETLDNAQSPQPDGTAKLCLGCHDGTVAIDTFDKYEGGAVFIDQFDGGGFKVPGFSDDGGNLDLRGGHPLSIKYDDVDGGLAPITNAMGTSGTIEDVLDNGKVQCSSCHDVHDQESVAGTHLLRVSTKTPASGLCLTCHDK